MLGGKYKAAPQADDGGGGADPADATRSVPEVLLPTLVSMPPIIGWFDPTANGGAVRRAANSYLPAKGDPGVRLAGLRRGDLVAVGDGQVAGVNGAAPARLAAPPELGPPGAVPPAP